MIENDDYLTIKEFANEAGVSVQAVYQRLNKDLKPFLKVFKGKKTLNIKGLELFSGNKNFKAVEQDFKDDFKATLNSLNKQLNVKDQQIQELNNRLAHALQLNENNQILLKAEQEKRLLIEVELEEQEKSKKKWKFWK